MVLTNRFSIFSSLFSPWLNVEEEKQLFLTSFVTACEREVVLCREHFVGSLATIARFMYRYVVSVDVELTPFFIAFQVYITVWKTILQQCQLLLEWIAKFWFIQNMIWNNLSLLIFCKYNFGYLIPLQHYWEDKALCLRPEMHLTEGLLR